MSRNIHIHAVSASAKREGRIPVHAWAFSITDKDPFHDTGSWDGNALRRALSRRSTFRSERLSVQLEAVTEALMLLARSRVEFDRVAVHVGNPLADAMAGWGREFLDHGTVHPETFRGASWLWLILRGIESRGMNIEWNPEGWQTEDSNHEWRRLTSRAREELEEFPGLPEQSQELTEIVVARIAELVSRVGLNPEAEEFRREMEALGRDAIPA